MKRVLALLLAMTATACASGPTRPYVVPLRYAEAGAARAPSQDASFRTAPPAVAAESTPPPAQIQSFKLDNGLTVLFVERRSFPIVSTRLVVDIAALGGDDVGGGRAQLVGSVFLSPPGGVLLTGGGCGRVACWVTSHGPSEQLDDMLERVGRLVRAADQPREEYERRLATAARGFAASAYAPAVALRRNARGLLFGREHAYGESSATAPPTLDEVMSFRSQAFVPLSATLVVVGDAGLDAVRAAVEKHFGSWVGARPVIGQPPAPPVPSGPRIVAYSDSRMVQMFGVAATRGPAPGDRDAAAFGVLVDLLGGTPTSAAFRQVRENMVAAYAVGASVDLLPGASMMSLGGTFDADKAVESMRTLLGAVAAARDAEPEVEPLERAKGVALTRWRRAMSTAEGIAALLADAVTLGLPPESSQDLPARVRSVTPADVRAAATKYLAPEQLHLVFVGNPFYLAKADSLGFGKVTRTNPYGEPLP